MSARSAVPTIGVTVSSRATEKQGRDCRRALEEHGARALELRPQDGKSQISGLAGLLLSGGGDVHPKYFGESPRAELYGVDCERDEMELCLTRAALAAGLPVLGICRGAQVLGVALGGKLVQDIPSERRGALTHKSGSAGGEAGHRVEIAEESRLRKIMGARRVRVNSSHHQANGCVGDGARAVAWSEDGVVEAIECDGPHFVAGVQWHPERMCRRAPRQRRLFEAFVAAAREYAGRGPNSRRSECR